MTKLKGTPKLEKLRKERGWTQAELAERAGLLQNDISRFDRQTQGSYVKIISLARALGVAVEELFDIEEIGE
ncbi:helix-turn-helix domain-containing protein [Paenibacillus melissococcoides]|uniref:Helix-turn-helix domain-containing protein n=1 Tax=Paenibacillus melissococcoides TaxID=2912268 RepID=A0ABN8TZR3_9BACL|nr:MULTISPECIES: helix-turn-helix transcriptional regulator [Paenibacillus]MEB9895357.1 helix-turn-helix transcriptional regulator [Bacillus cereus]CAH8244277.1 helix-turn-helix domain-containing protein [Paenibacillus melissococcoides]CAH8703523.1 helix-turn-helix domain-containing protein [Paenibacillus melissococcoides]CAH8705940.1 helix-turn-helix domain-containing protein [Paenibacillus melissococcoides]GIO81537.1 hypothetical protein J6TS7_51470 [Paenibacillus dendritiformis]